MLFMCTLVQVILSILLLQVNSTQLAISNLGSSYTILLNVGDSSQPSVFVIDTLSGDIIVDLNIQSNFTVEDECAELLYDQSTVTVYGHNCSYAYAQYTLSFGDDNNITTDVFEADHIVYQDPALHQWRNSSGMLGLGNSKCSKEACFNQSRTAFHDMLATIYQTNVFALDLNNNSKPSYMDVGNINSVYANVFEWAPRQIATFPQYYDFLLHNFQFCNVNIMSNLSTNWQSRIDTASACLTLPAELYNNVISWLDLTVTVEQFSENVTKEEILHQMQMPDLTFSLNDGGVTFHISLKDLIVDASELVNFPNIPTIQLSYDGIVETSEWSLCLLSGAYVSSASTTSPPEQIVIGSLALRSLYVGIDVDVSSPRIGFANKRAASDPIVTTQCAAPVTCSGSQYSSQAQNSCRNPDCRKYFYAALNAETHRCEYDNGSIVVGILLVVIFAVFEVFAFFVSQYTSYMVIPVTSRKFSVDGVTLTIGAYLTILLDRLIIDVLCWMPEDSTGNVGLTPGGQQEEEVEVDTDGDDAHNVHMFLQFDAVSASQEQRNAFLIEGEANGENTIDHEEENVHLAY